VQVAMRLRRSSDSAQGSLRRSGAAGPRRGIAVQPSWRAAPTRLRGEAGELRLERPGCESASPVGPEGAGSLPGVTPRAGRDPTCHRLMGASMRRSNVAVSWDNVTMTLAGRVPAGSHRMNDTPPELAQKSRQVPLSRSGEERPKMGSSPHATALALVRASVLARAGVAGRRAPRAGPGLLRPRVRRGRSRQDRGPRPD